MQGVVLSIMFSYLAKNFIFQDGYNVFLFVYWHVQIET